MAPAADAVQTVAANLSTPFSETQQTLSLTANLSDTTTPSTTVSGGTVTFTVKDSTGATVGSAIPPATVSGGKASASFNLPANEASGKYTIDVSYSDTAGTFSDGGDTPGILTVNPASVKVVGGNSSAAFNDSSQQVTLTANVTDNSFPADVVNEGKVTFTVKDHAGSVVGSSVQGTVSSGKATASFTMPPGTAPGAYTVAVAYSDGSSSGNFSDDGTDTSGALAVSAAATKTQASDATASFSENAQNVTLTANVTSSAGIVNEGNVDFTLLDSNGNAVGTTATSAVANGSASVSYALPAGTVAGSYTIEAAYSDSASNFDTSLDESHTLTINAAGFTSVNLTTANITPNVGNGTAQVTLTAQVSIPGGTATEGAVSFTVGSASGTANVSNNGTATVQLTLPIQDVLNGFSVQMSYTDNATHANFAASNATQSVSTNVYNSLFQANLTFDSSNNETMQFAMGSLPLFGASYSSSTGLLSQISVGSLSLPTTYSNLGNTELASVAGIPWGIIFRDSSGNMTAIADVETGSDGSLVWVFYDTNHQVLGESPYGE